MRFSSRMMSQPSKDRKELLWLFYNEERSREGYSKAVMVMKAEIVGRRRSVASQSVYRNTHRAVINSIANGLQLEAIYFIAEPSLF